jgi:chromosome segregation ATPase
MPLALAQVQEVTSTSVPANREEWLLTVDVIQKKVQGLLEENNKLNTEYIELMQQAQKMRQAVVDQSQKNDEIRRLLKERGGRTDQQIRIDELSQQIKARQPKVVLRQKQVDHLKNQATVETKKAELKKLKISDWELHQNAAPAVKPVEVKEDLSSGDKELDRLRKEIEEQKGKEVALEQELESLQNQKAQAVARQEELAKEIDGLKQQLEDIKAKKVPAETAASKLRRSRFEAMTQQKSELEAQIKEFEGKIEKLKDPGALSFSMQKKKIIKEVVEADARKEQLSQKINDLKEDISILREQTATLERKVNFRKGKGRHVW